MPQMVGIAERCCAAWLKEGPGVSGFEKAKEYTFRVRPLQESHHALCADVYQECAAERRRMPAQ